MSGKKHHPAHWPRCSRCRGRFDGAGGYRTCLLCRQDSRRHHAARRKALLANRLCTRCKRPCAQGARCPDCRAKRRAAYAPPQQDQPR
jgi:hypothetical protein